MTPSVARFHRSAGAEIRIARTAQAGFVLAPNFSVGVNLFFRVVAEAAQALGVLGPPRWRAVVLEFGDMLMERETS